MSSSWKQLFRNRCSVYALDRNNTCWIDRGVFGTIVLFQDSQNYEDARLKWEKKDTNQKIWWKLFGSTLKPKGQRALVLKALTSVPNEEEILAIRFNSEHVAVQFAVKYHNIFPDVCDMNIWKRYLNKMYMNATSYNDDERKKAVENTLKRMHTMRNNDNITISLERHQKECTVHGYLQNIKNQHESSKIIPLAIIQLCLAFYVNDPWDYIINILSANEDLGMLLKFQKITENLLENDKKYRNLFFANDRLQNKILNIHGGYNGSFICLYNLGFKLDTENNDKLICNEIDNNIIQSCLACLKQKAVELDDNLPFDEDVFRIPTCIYHEIVNNL
eukprot:141363_1